MTLRLFAGFDSLAVDQGGVARVSRLVARVLTDPAADLPALTSAATLHDTAPPADLSIRPYTAAGSRLRFAWAINRAALTHTHFFYSFLGLARAHPRVPILRRPYLAFLHGVEAWPGPWARADRVAAACRAAGLIANSAHTARRAADLHPSFSRARVCWLATEEDDPPPVPTERPPPRVLIVGRMDEGYKGHAELIAAWPRVVASVPDAVLSIAGRGPRADEFRRQASESPAAGRIEFLGFVPEAEMPALWARTRVFAMPSRGEGFGLVYIEAMRHGVPVVASVHDAGGEINSDGVSGYNVDMESPDELVDRLRRLLGDPNHAAALGAGGRARWSEYFRYSCFRARLVPHLRGFLGSAD